MRRLCLFLLAAWLLGADRAQGALQFDLFIGYDGLVREASWFPIASEIFNDGPSFQGVIEIMPGGGGADQVWRIPVELPTNTRKRIIIPMFAPGSNLGQWSARLLDERGKVRAEQQNLAPKVLNWEAVLMGALPRTYAGTPVLPEVRAGGYGPQRALEVARLLADQFPDSPMALEGLTAIYLNSEKALDLKVNQVAALLTWLEEGGQLIIVVEQPTDVTGTPWLKRLLPCALTDAREMAIDQALQDWVREPPGRRISWRPTPGGPFNPNAYASATPDPNFGGARMVVLTGALRDGWSRLSAAGTPLVIEARRGRGRLTVLTFNPEREPFHSWKNRGWFWAKTLEIPVEKLNPSNMPGYGGWGWSIDGVFGALLDTDQVQKLPVQWLLLLLVGYLAVIGPFDQYWLKRINRQMLTWITFPAYVVFFSFLIYFIGYKLRASVTEWNEMHLVDILPRGEKAQWRGRSFLDVYSSANARYALANNLPYAALRGEFAGRSFYGGSSANRADVNQLGNNYRAQIYVPVWTSQLYVSDWLKSGPQPLRASVALDGNQWAVTVENLLDRPVTETRLVVDGKVFDLGTIPARDRKMARFQRYAGMALVQFAQENGRYFQMAIEQRRSTLATGNAPVRLREPASVAEAASFPSLVMSVPGQARGFVSPEGLDLTPVVERGDAVVLAFEANQSPIPPIRQFKPPRSKQYTLWRLAVPVKGLETRASF